MIDETLMSFSFVIGGSVKLSKYITKYRKTIDMVTLRRGDVVSVSKQKKMKNIDS